jgi:uncharacterized protein (DUF697 family)
MSTFETQYEEEYATQGEGVLGGELEVELANQFLEVQSEEELEQFLGDLVKTVAKGVGGFIKSPVGKALGGALKSVAKAALPAAGAALGSFIAPGVGTAIGGQLGSAASNLFELELEGMDREQAEFEVAKKYVRFASDATSKVALANQDVPPWTLVNAAVADAARETAPGLLASGNGRPRSRQATGGRWVRRGRRIVVLGA